MVSTTRSQHFARRSTLRSWQNWKPFVSPPVALRKHTPQKARMVHPLRQKNKNPPTEVFNRLPLKILEKILLDVDANTILVQCQRVCKTWNKTISHSSAIQQTLGFQPPPRSKVVQVNPFKRLIHRCIHIEWHKERGGACECWCINLNKDYEDILARVEASWRRMLLGRPSPFPC